MPVCQAQKARSTGQPEVTQKPAERPGQECTEPQWVGDFCLDNFGSPDSLAVLPQLSSPLQGEGAFAGHCGSRKGFAPHPTRAWTQVSAPFHHMYEEKQPSGRRHRVASWAPQFQFFLLTAAPYDARVSCYGSSVHELGGLQF